MGDRKRARLSNSSMGRDWSRDLHEDLIVSIAKCLSSLEDFTFFGAVCKSWRSATTKLVKEKQYRDTTGIFTRLLTQQVPLLMLPLAIEKHPQESRVLYLSDEEVGFYSPGKGEIRYKVDVPKGLMRMCFSSLGWLMFVPTTSGGDWSLFHPLNHAKIELPYRGTYLRGSIEKFALSSSPSYTSDYFVMGHGRYSLGFLRPGLDENWKTIIVGEDALVDLVYYNGQFYFLYFSGCVSVFDMDKQELRVVAPKFPRGGQLLGPNVRIKKRYLVESAGVLLVVLFTCTSIFEDVAYGCRVFEVPFTDSKSWLDSELKSLGKRTIFLSCLSSSFSIETSDYSRCKPNCIYFMNNKIIFPRKRKDCGVYNMEDGTITRDFDNIFSFDEERGFHLWVQPSL